MTASIYKPPSKEAAQWKYDEIFGMLSHDLRTPLTGAVGFLGLLESANLTEEQRDDLEIAKCCMQDLRVMLDGILDCARMTDGRIPVNLQMASLRDILGTLVRQFAFAAARKDIHLKLDLSPDLPERLFLDEVKVRQIVENLLNNAVKFTASGTITIRADAARPPRETKLSPGIFKIEIEDTGIGISEGDLQRVFDPFFCSAAMVGETKSTGLGLAIVEKLTATLGGSLSMKSSIGIGTVVTATLPFPTEDSDVQIMRVP